VFIVFRSVSVLLTDLVTYLYQCEKAYAANCFGPRTVTLLALFNRVYYSQAHFYRSFYK